MNTAINCNLTRSAKSARYIALCEASETLRLLPLNNRAQKHSLIVQKVSESGRQFMIILDPHDATGLPKVTPEKFEAAVFDTLARYRVTIKWPTKAEDLPEWAISLVV